MSLNATSTASKNRQGIQGRPTRHPEWARQNVFRHPSSKRKAFYDARPPRKRRPPPGPPLAQRNSIPGTLSHGTRAAPTIHIEDWSIFPPSRKFLSQRLSFITSPARTLRLSSSISDTQQDLLSVPTMDSLGHLCSPLSRTGRFKHVDQKESERANASISKPASPSDFSGYTASECLHPDTIRNKLEGNKLGRSHGAGESLTKLHETIPALKRFSNKEHSLPAAGSSSLLCTGTDDQAERDFRLLNKLERVGQEPEATTDKTVTPVIPDVSTGSTSPVKTHKKAGPPTASLTVTLDPQPFFGLRAPAKLPIADFGDVPYPFVFDFDFYLSEASVPATPLLLTSFPGLGSEFSSPPTDYFDTPTPSPRLPVAPLLMHQTSLSDTASINYETPDASETSGDLTPKSLRESLDTSGMTSPGTEDIPSSQSEYSIPSTDDANGSVASSALGKKTGKDLDRPFFNKIGYSSHRSNTSAVFKTVPLEPRNVGEGRCALASVGYASRPPADKSCGSGSEGESNSIAHTKTEDSLTIDESTFCNRHRRLLESLTFSVSNKTQLRDFKKGSPERPTLFEQSNVASVVAYPTVPRVSSNNIAYSPLPLVDSVNATVGSHFHPASRNGLVTSQRTVHHRAIGPIKPLTPSLVPTAGASISEKMMRWGFKGFKGSSERERPSFSPTGGVGFRGTAELPQVTRRRAMPEKF